MVKNLTIFLIIFLLVSNLYFIQKVLDMMQNMNKLLTLYRSHYTIGYAQGVLDTSRKNREEGKNDSE